MSDLLYKVLNEDGSAFHGGSGKWPLPEDGKPGAWLTVEGELVPCSNGLHLCRRQDLIVWLGPAIYEGEADDEIVESDDRVVVRKARLLRRLSLWDEKTARLFAADCSEHVLPIFEKQYPNDERPRKAIAATRAFARGEISAAARAAAGAAVWLAPRAAARAAAGAAARAAARAAAWNAAGDAAWDAARAAAWNAAWTAAWTAAWNAAWNAARATETAWQTDCLFGYLEPKE